MEFLKGRHIKAGHSTHSFFPCLATHPLRVTRHCRSPSFRKMSTTVSMGVWSVTVKGLKFRMRLSFSGCGLLAGSSGGSSVKYMMELLTMPSCLCLAFSRRMAKKKNAKTHTKNLVLNYPHLLLYSISPRGVPRANSTVITSTWAKHLWTWHPSHMLWERGPAVTRMFTANILQDGPPPTWPFANVHCFFLDSRALQKTKGPSSLLLHHLTMDWSSWGQETSFHCPITLAHWFLQTSLQLA